MIECHAYHQGCDLLFKDKGIYSLGNQNHGEYDMLHAFDGHPLLFKSDKLKP